MLSFPAWRCILKVQNYTREKRILMDKILIINDSIVQSKILESILQPIYLTEIENDSQNAVKKAERFLPSLIILDIIMPVKDGFQVLAELKANPRTDTIPVILITGLSDIGNEEKGLMLGAVDYITKPFSPAIIKARIKAHIQLCNYRKAMEHLALFDALTGLPNRHAYAARSQREWSRGEKIKQPLSIALLDIDFFKQYNDHFGHPAGDILLKQLGALLSDSVKDSDNFVARYGGEEFVILLPNTNAGGGFLFCETIRKRIEDLQIPNSRPSGEPCTITVSIGGWLSFLTKVSTLRSVCL